MYSGTRKFTDENEFEDERLRQNASVSWPEDLLSTSHSSAGQMFSSFVDQQDQYTMRQNTSTHLEPESYIAFRSNASGAGRLLSLPLVTQQEQYLSGRNAMIGNPMSIIPSYNSGFSGTDRLSSLSLLPLTLHTQSDQYLPGQHSNISGRLSYIHSFTASQTSTDIVASSSLVTGQGPLTGNLPVRYGANVDNISQEHSNPFLSLVTSAPVLPHDLSMQSRLGLNRNIVSSLLPAQSLNPLTNRSQLLRQHEYNSIVGGRSPGMHTVMSESGYSSFDQWDHSAVRSTDGSFKDGNGSLFARENAGRAHSPSDDTVSSHMVRKDSLFSKTSQSSNDCPSPVHHSGSSSPERRENFSSKGTCSPSFEHKTSDRRKHRYSPVRESGSSCTERKKFFSKETNKKHDHSPGCSSKKSPVDKKDYKFSTKEMDFSSRGSFRSQDRHRSSVDRNVDLLREKRKNRFSSDKTRLTRIRESRHSPVDNNISPIREKRFSSGETRLTRIRESRHSPVDNNKSPLREKRFSSGETRLTRIRESRHSPVDNNKSPLREKRFSSGETRLTRIRESRHSPVDNNKSPLREKRFSSGETRLTRSRESRHSPVDNNKSPLREKRFSSGETRLTRSRDHSPPVRSNVSPPRAKIQSRYSSTKETIISSSETRSSRSRKRHHSPVQGGKSSSMDKRERDNEIDMDRSKESRYATDRSSLTKKDKLDYNSLNDKRDGDGTTSRALRCYCLPDPNIQRTVTFKRTDTFYKTANTSSQKSTSVATDEVAKLHKEFEEIMSSVASAQTQCQSSSDASDTEDVINDTKEDSQYVWELVDKLETDDDDSSEESESDVDLDGYITIDESDSDSSITSEDSQQSLHGKMSRIRSRSHPRRLHDELWFNVIGELNHGRECLCSPQDKKKWIVHSIYQNEQMPAACEALGNNSLQLYHYWVTVYPHTNFMTEHPTIIESDGWTYTFEGFSLLSHFPLSAVPRCYLTRFNINYEIIFVQEPIPNNFCIKDLDLFSKYLFHEILEMFDWDLSNKGNDDHCQMFHFLPRFTRKLHAMQLATQGPTHQVVASNAIRPVSSDGSERYELLSMRKVLEHLLNSRKPLIQNVMSSDRNDWEEFVGSCVNTLVTRPGWKPSSLRIDDIEQHGRDGMELPRIVHHGIRPVRLSFSGNPICQKLFKSYLKLRNSIMNRPDSTQKERLKLIKMKLTLDNMKMKDSLRRDCYVNISTDGMLRTGLNSDVTQHALLLPVLVHHARYHLSLKKLEENILYEFKDKALLQLALTHPSYVMNYGTNADHARNTLSNCGVKQPRYGDKRNRFKNVKKKGIVHLIDIMAKLEDLEGSQSFIQHNERLEFLGDAILEFICTCHLYFLFPEMNEGGLVTHRCSLVKNTHLACVAKKFELDRFMQFSHGPDLCHEDDMDHGMANCLEALLGAIYLDSDVNTVRKVFCQLAFDENELRELWGNLNPHPLQSHLPRGDRNFISSSEILKKLVKFEESIGVQFTHIRLLARAFTHPQVGFNNLTLGNNQRMELLGDSVVQWVVTDYLYHHFPEHHEGHLTLLRSSLVNRKMQADIAGEIGLNLYVNYGVSHQTPKLRQKHMADLFEAFLASLFIDKGIEPVKLFCKVCVFPRLRDVILNQQWLDAKSQLQSCCITQANRTDIVPVYKVLKNIGSPNMKLYTVGVYFKGRRFGTGDGDNVREAEMNAAQNALAFNYFPEYARQKRVLNQKHKHLKNKN